MAHKLFAYGTLIFPEIAKRVARISEVPVDALLSDYARYEIADRDYWRVPGLIPEKGKATTGKLYQAISDESLALLDLFEGIADGDYTRETVTVALFDGSKTEAYCYLVNPNTKLGKEWDQTEFEAQSLKEYLIKIAPISILD